MKIIRKTATVQRRGNRNWVGLVLMLLSTANRCCDASYFADWSMLGRDRNPTCVPIPANMSLCRNVGYTKMRLPNLLDHESMQEASQQASSWIPLLNVKCHEDTQLFLCSLFAPVCLERPIYPCRSLCQKVKAGCSGTMKRYGFPWPSMLDCDKFPLDNDMCITSPAEKGAEPKPDESVCDAKPCSQTGTYENILANFCQADFVVKMKIRQVRRLWLLGAKVNTVYKTWRGTPTELKKLRKPRLKLRRQEQCCSEWVKSQSKNHRYLVMGRKEGERLVPTFIHSWTKSDNMRRARRMFKQIDCSNLQATSQRVVAEALAPHAVISKADSRKRRRTLKSMFDFRDDDVLPTNYHRDVESTRTLGGGGRRRPGKRRAGRHRRLQRQKKRQRNQQGEKPRRRNHLKRTSRLQKKWLSDDQSVLPWSVSENDILSNQEDDDGNASKQQGVAALPV